MKGGTRAAVAIGVGYVLGRRRKMRLATVLAVGAATGGIAGLGGSALRRGAQALGSTEALGKLAPQFGDIAGTVRGDLVEAGKAAAVAAVTGRIDALTDSLHDRAESLRNPAARRRLMPGEARGRRGAGGRGRQAARPARRRRRDEDQAEPEDSGEPGYDEPEDDEDWADEDQADEDQADEAMWPTTMDEAAEAPAGAGEARAAHEAGHPSRGPGGERGGRER